MDLTLDSAFSTGGFVGHASYLLLVISMLMRNISLLRILVILSACTAIAYDWLWLRDPVGVFWETLLVLVNVIQLIITWHQNRSARFSPEEKAFMGGHLPNLSRHQRRKFLNQGMWITGDEDTVLTQEGVPVSHLFFLSSGQGIVISGGEPVAVCDPGTFIGEMTALSGEPANGTVKLISTSRYWAIESERLRNLVRKEAEIGTALEASFAKNMRDKLVRSNRFIMDSGGVKRPTPPNKPVLD